MFVTFEGDGALILADAAARGWDAVRHGIFFVDGNRRPELFAALASRAAFGARSARADGDPTRRATPGPAETVPGKLLPPLHPASRNQRREPLRQRVPVRLAIEIAGHRRGRLGDRDAMGQTASGAEIPAGDAASLRAAIASQQQVNYLGASGDVDLDCHFREPLPPYYVSALDPRSRRDRGSRGG